ncbi:hypothetical protein VOLCADRAFT_121275 [Volvox carteri f. nagariensis]|uniref:Helicase C-terminal domain-containing protein n=1 Tax=Volvox carteri f. nagariensis TaxID=3068 RepID=D8U6D5_VOLCA|nr:uncharacterized protein VOLCADRAFT_121275 [Volvox carteri f. nagariensis]EFJ44697.1 hypothetical protein VOLCADRAFT_121275 [Volvox carteri f. nagariensis]|eukprot:XP_002954273.1 hypothetical protein VOLCADRAFT_121275 [Volvox carteri f. nagariensis]
MQCKVLDEAHHCKDEHPYAQVMAMYNANVPKDAPTPQPRVLAVTASPASERDMSALDRRMADMLSRLRARLHCISEGDPEVAEVLPNPAIEMRVAMRSVDRDIITMLQALIAAVENSASNSKYLVTRLDPLGQWLSKGREVADKYRCPNLDLICRFLDVLRKAIELVEDAGFEGALPFLGRKAVVLCQGEVEAHGGIGINDGGGRQVPLAHPASELRTAMFEAAAAAAAAAATSSFKGASTAAAGGSVMPQMLSSLEAAAAALPTVYDRRTAALRGPAATGSTATANSCRDVYLRVSKLLKDLLTGPCHQVLLKEDFLGSCFVSGELKVLRLGVVGLGGKGGGKEGERKGGTCCLRCWGESGLRVMAVWEEDTFPKFWALMEYLQRYRNKPNFHGIIFVRTRQEVLELIGHNNTTGKRAGLAPEQDRHGRGMSDTQQQQVLNLFKETGCKVLVATSAAEEGLDVPSCEFVVRYNAAATGIQLLQSRGRARQKVAEFCAILQEGTLDNNLHVKSYQEEANMHEWHRLYMEVTRGSAATGGADA